MQLNRDHKCNNKTNLTNKQIIKNWKISSSEIICDTQLLCFMISVYQNTHKKWYESKYLVCYGIIT